MSLQPGRLPGRMRRDTRAILRIAAPILGVGLLCSWLAVREGGLSAHGPTTTAGWLLLMTGLGCVPSGALFLLLGIGKYFEDRKRS